MLKVRTTKISSGNTAVQVVYRYNQKTKVVKHIGTARTVKELGQLKQLGYQYIASNTNIPPLLPEVFHENKSDNFLVSLNHLQLGASFHRFAYEVLSHLYAMNGFTSIHNSILRDLSFMRLIEPSSKLHAVTLLKEYFGITYPINTVYEQLKTIDLHREAVEKAVVAYAKEHFSFDCSLVFYDVTTLYFESFKSDEDVIDTYGHLVKGLRKTGYGKERKPGQPLVLIGLLVTKEGYPLSVDMFEGDTYEGKTVIPAIMRFKKQYNISTLTVVADAGMLSQTNIEELKAAELSFIVGARIKSMKKELMLQVATALNKIDGVSFRIEGTNYGSLIVSYSHKRAIKDKSDRKKQLNKAAWQLKDPSTITKRSRFIKETTKSKFQLNEELIKTDEQMDGIKGYYTNLTECSKRFDYLPLHRPLACRESL